jgi:hypothetical protein
MAQKEVIVYAKISFVGPDHVAFATIADKGQGTKNVTVTRDKFSSVFDVDNGRGVLCYKGTNRTITSGDKVTLYFPSLKDNSITKILYVEERQDQISSLLKQEDYYHKLQLGSSVFYVPPTSIKVDKISTTKRVPTIRSKGSIKSQSGHTDTRISLTLFFPDLYSINGPSSGNDNSLMSLIAQFMRTPFVPVLNHYLNYVHKIDAVCLHDLTVQTVEGFPRSLQATITLFAFEYMAFMPQEPSFVDTIDGDLYRWYYKRGLMDNTVGQKLKPMTRSDSGIAFFTMDETFLHERKAERQLAAKSGMTVGDAVRNRFERAEADVRTFEKAFEEFDKATRGERCTRNSDYWKIDYTRAEAGYGGATLSRYGWIAIKVQHFSNLNKLKCDEKPPLVFPFLGEGWLTFRYSEGKWSTKKEEFYQHLKNTLSIEQAFVEQKKTEEEGNLDTSRYLKIHDINYSSIIVTDVAVSYQNTFARLPLLGYEAPAYQFLGTQDVYGKISMEVFGDEALKGLQDLYEYCQRVAREYKYDMVTNYVRLKNDLLQLFGINYVFIDTLSCSTVPNFPGRYYVEMTFMDFDVTQKKREYGEIISHDGENPIIKTSPSIFNSKTFKPGYVIFPKGIKPNTVNETIEWARLESLFKNINLYPDLDLPTYDEVDKFLKSIGRKEGYPRPENAGVYVDPDFYFRPHFDMRHLTKEVIARQPEMTIYETDTSTSRVYEYDFKIGDKTSDRIDSRSKSLISESAKEQHDNYMKSVEFYVQEAIELSKHPENAIEKHLGSIQNAAEAGQFRDARKLSVQEYNEKYSKTAIEERAKQEGYRIAAEMGYKVLPYDEAVKRNMLTELYDVEYIPDDGKPRPIGYGPEGRAAEPEWSSEWHDAKTYDKTGTMARAFPTCHVFLVDEGARIGWYKLWDNFYGLNAISSIEVVKSRKIAADTVFMSVANTYQRFVDRKFKIGKVEFNLNRFFQLSIDEEMKQRHAAIQEHMGLLPGARLHIRMGYGNNLTELPIMFNGTVTEVSCGEILNVIAQSDALELCSVLNYRKGWVAGNLKDGEEPSNMLARLLIRGDKQGFGRFWSAIKTNWMLDDSHGITHFGTPNFFLGMYEDAGELGQNIYPGNGTGLHENGELGLDANDEPNVHLMMEGKSTWDVAQLLSMYVPNYTTAVHPFEFRSTLFYGKPWWPLTYGYDISSTKKEGYVEAHSYQDGTKRKLGFYVRAKKKPFRQWHLYTSFGHILDNRVRATSQGMYHNVIATVARDKIFNLDHSIVEETVEANADKDIYPHIQRTTSIVSELYARKPFAFLSFISGIYEWCQMQLGTLKTAQFLAMSTVRDYMKDMYQGDLVIMGDPSVKPHDGMYIGDAYNEMFGATFVKQVVHQFSLDTGFISSVSPDCAAGVIESEFSDRLVWAASVASGTLLGWGLTCQGAGSLRGAMLLRLGQMMGRGAQSATWLMDRYGTGVVTKGLWQASAGLGQAQNALTQAGNFVKAAAVPGWAMLAVTAALILASKIISNMVERKLSEAQCVVMSLLQVKGQEFSAGITGHKGITVCSVGGKSKISWWDKIIQTLPGWVQTMFNTEDPDLSPRILFGSSSVEVGDALFGANTVNYDDEFKKKILMMTGTFETSIAPPGSFAAVSGNFDGAGLSFGTLQFNLKSGTLQALLKRMVASHSSTVQSIFGKDYGELQRMLRMTPSQAIAWGDKLSYTKGKDYKRYIREPWNTYFHRLGADPNCQRYQVEAAEEYFNKALSYFKYLGLQTERGFALCFDIAVQAGSISIANMDAMKRKFETFSQSLGAQELEYSKMHAIAHLKHGAIKIKANPGESEKSRANREKMIKDDFIKRKLVIVNGEGTCHGVAFDLYTMFDISIDRRLNAG